MDAAVREIMRTSRLRFRLMADRNFVVIMAVQTDSLSGLSDIQYGKLRGRADRTLRGQPAHFHSIFSTS